MYRKLAIAVSVFACLLLAATASFGATLFQFEDENIMSYVSWDYTYSLNDELTFHFNGTPWLGNEIVNTFPASAAPNLTAAFLAHDPVSSSTTTNGLDYTVPGYDYLNHPHNISYPTLPDGTTITGYTITTRLVGLGGSDSYYFMTTKVLGPISSSGIPEPPAMIMALLGGLFPLVWRKR